MGDWGRLGVSTSLCWWQWKAPAGSSPTTHWFIWLSSTRLATATTPPIIPDTSQCPARLGYVPRNWARDKSRHPLNMGNREFIKTSAQNSSFPQPWGCCCAAGNSSAAGLGVKPQPVPQWSSGVGNFIQFLGTLSACVYTEYTDRVSLQMPSQPSSEPSAPALQPHSHPTLPHRTPHSQTPHCSMQCKGKREFRYPKLPSSVNSELKPSSQTHSSHTFN